MDESSGEGDEVMRASRTVEQLSSQSASGLMVALEGETNDK